MMTNAKFVHTSIVARDWKQLALFYQQVFDCTPVPPERDLSGQWLEAATDVPAARLRGIHLRLPGYGDGGPTLEIFQYSSQEKRPVTAINRPGIAHIAFAVSDVQATLDAVLAAGGSAVGDIVTVQIPGAGSITFVYATDPEGNIIELQRWSS